MVKALAPTNHVYGLARLRSDEERRALEAAGVEPVAASLAGDLRGVPDDADYVLHFAVVKSGDFALDLRANAEGSGRLVARCRKAKAFLHVSSAAVYEAPGHRAVAEDAPLGDNHRVLMPTYSIAKIAAESTVRLAPLMTSCPGVGDPPTLTSHSDSAAPFGKLVSIVAVNGLIGSIAFWSKLASVGQGAGPCAIQ